MKFFLLLLFLQSLHPRKVKRIVRTNYNLHLKYTHQEIIDLAEQEFGKIEGELQYFE